MRLIKCEAQTEHPWPLLPAVHERTTLGPVEGEIAEDGEAVGMLSGGLNGELIGLRVPARRMDYRSVNASFIHLPQGIGAFQVVGPPGREGKSGRVAQRVHGGVDLRAQAAAAAPDRFVTIFLTAPALC